MRNNKLIRFIQQSIKLFKLDLSGYNILVPALTKEPSLAPVMASMAGAKNVYIMADDIEVVNKVCFFETQLGLKSNFVFIQKETPQILSGLDIIIKGEGISYIDAGFISALKKDCVISVLPENLDFRNIKDISLEDCARREIPVVAVDPGDKNLMLYKYFSHLIIKKCYEADINVFKSRILLVGCGELLENVLSFLKSVGAQVYVAYTDRDKDKTYTLKHLFDTDIIVVIEYPQKSKSIIGNDGFIKIEDILDINPELKIIHLCGKIETRSLSLGRISTIPEIITQNSLNVSIDELDSRAITEITAAVMKAAESLIKLKKRTILPGESIVSYNIINAGGPVVLGRIMF